MVGVREGGGHCYSRKQHGMITKELQAERTPLYSSVGLLTVRDLQNAPFFFYKVVSIECGN